MFESALVFKESNAGWRVISELRRPLGIAIVGGLLVSQVVTLYTTPVVYLVRRKAAAMAPQADARP